MLFHNRRRFLSALAIVPWIAPADWIASTNKAYGQTPILRPTSSLGLTSGRVVRLEPVGTTNTRVVVTAMASDPRGELLAVAGDDHVIRILEMNSMRVRQLLRDHRDLIRTIAFDAAGDRLASAGNDGQLILWKRGETFEPIQVMPNAPAIACVRFAPDGRKLAAVGFASDIYIIGPDQSSQPKLTCGCNDLRAVAFRDDGHVLAVGGRSGELHLYNMQTGVLIKEARLHEGRIRDLTFGRHSNEVVSVGEDGIVTVYNTDSMSETHRVELPGGRCFAIALIDSQRAAVAGSDNVIHIVDVDQGKLVQSLSGHDGSVSSLAASGGVLFSGGFDATIRRWMVSDAAQERIAETDSKSVEKK